MSRASDGFAGAGVDSRRVVGAPTGIMDQSASLLDEPDHGILLDCQNLETETVALGFAGAGVGLPVIDTRTSHSHADGGFASRRRSCEDGARRLGVGSLRALGPDDLPRHRVRGRPPGTVARAGGGTAPSDR